MAESLVAGANVALTNGGEPAGVAVTVGWDYTASEFYIDAHMMACDASRKVIDASHFVFFNNHETPDGAVTLTPVDTSTAVERERIGVDFSKIAEPVDRLVVGAVVYDATHPDESFKGASNIVIRVLGVADEELARYQVDSVDTAVTALVLGELYRNRGEWKFRAIGQGYSNGLDGLAHDYGLPL